MTYHAYAIYLEERTPIIDAEPSELVNEELIEVHAYEAAAEEAADVLNMDGVGSLTSRIRAVAKRIEVTERAWRALA